MTVYAELLAAAKAVYEDSKVRVWRVETAADGEIQPAIWDRLRDAIEACECKINGRQLIAESDRLVPRFTESQAKAKAKDA